MQMRRKHLGEQEELSSLSRPFHSNFKRQTYDTKYELVLF